MKYLIFDHSKNDFVELEKPFLLFYGMCENNDHVLLTDCLFNSYEIDKTDLNCFPGIPDFKTYSIDLLLNSTLSSEENVNSINILFDGGFITRKEKEEITIKMVNTGKINASDLY